MACLGIAREQFQFGGFIFFCCWFWFCFTGRAGYIGRRGEKVCLYFVAVVFCFLKGVFGGTNSTPEFLGYNVKNNTYNLLAA